MALTFANKVTICRILAVPFFVATLLSYTPERDYLRYVALGIFSLAVITDVIDGYIARTRHQKTRAGAILDPLADKLLLISSFLCLFKIRMLFEFIRFPVWLVVAVISRDIILVVGISIIQIVNGSADVVPSRWGKATTFLQVCCIVGMLLQWEASSAIWYVTVVLTVVSGIGYLRGGIKTLNALSEQNFS